MPKPNPTVSILLPSRGRPNELIRAIKSCFDTCSEKERVEVIVRLDMDDPSLGMTLDLMPRDFDNLHVILGPRMGGYEDLYKFTNECAKLSSGEWLLGFNDDAWFGKQNWDKSLIQNPGKRVCFATVDRPIEHSHPRYVDFAKGPRFDFPIISRGIYEVIGSFCPVVIYDWFWYEATRMFPSLGGGITPDILIWHEYMRQPKGVNEFSTKDDPKVVEYQKPESQQIKQAALALIGKNL